MHRVIPSAICLILAVSATIHASELPGAKQIGPSCAFYGNIPALTSITGVNIADGTNTSLAFIKSVYGLRSGDFKIQSPFKKELFFALFGLETKSYNHYLPPQRASALLDSTIKYVEQQIIPALQQGQFISAQVNGRSRHPHNILLLDYRDNRFFYHNPTTGKIDSCGHKALAEKMLTKSSIHKHKVRPEYFIHYLSTSAPKNQKQNTSFSSVSKLPDQISMLDGKPQVLISYKSSPPTEISFFDGQQTQTLDLKETLTQLKSDGIRLGYLSIPRP